MSDKAYVKAYGASYGGKPPPPAYATQSVPAGYASQPEGSAKTGGPTYGASHYGAYVQYGGAPAAVGFAQLVAHQKVQVFVISATLPPPSTKVFTQSKEAIISSPTYLGWSIINLLCCFWPLGLAALIFSIKVSNARSTDEARAYSLTARNLNIAATVIAPVLLIIIVGSVVSSAAATVTAASASVIGPSVYGDKKYYEVSTSVTAGSTSVVGPCSHYYYNTYYELDMSICD